MVSVFNNFFVFGDLYVYYLNQSFPVLKIAQGKGFCCQKHFKMICINKFGDSPNTVTVTGRFYLHIKIKLFKVSSAEGQKIHAFIHF